MDSRKRSLAKTISWRVIASFTTFLLALIFFSDHADATEKATWIAAIEAVLKMLFYYYHERAWFPSRSWMKPSLRHVLKTITWRVIATSTTFALALAIFQNDANVLEKATGVAVVEVFLKMLFYYVHERVWFSFIKYGLEEPSKN